MRRFWITLGVAVALGAIGAVSQYALHHAGWLGNGIYAFGCVLIGASLNPFGKQRR